MRRFLCPFSVAFFNAGNNVNRNAIIYNSKSRVMCETFLVDKKMEKQNEKNVMYI